MAVLRRGSRGPLVSQMKRRLYAHGFWKRVWRFDGGFGPITERQVRSFQKSKGLLVDGEVGPQTWNRLNQPSFKKATGERARAVRWAEDCVGITEQPPYSNHGPRIDRWQKLSGFPDSGYAWCQMFVNASAYHATRGRLKPSVIGGYTPSVVEMANGGRYGLKRVKLGEARPGDWVYFKFPGVSSDFCDHVELFIADQGDSIRTIGGNTSPDSGGSQSNGGGVFHRVRSKSLVVAVVRPPFRD